MQEKNFQRPGLLPGPRWGSLLQQRPNAMELAPNSHYSGGS